MISHGRQFEAICILSNAFQNSVWVISQWVQIIMVSLESMLIQYEHHMISRLKEQWCVQLLQTERTIVCVAYHASVLKRFVQLIMESRCNVAQIPLIVFLLKVISWNTRYHHLYFYFPGLFQVLSKFFINHEKFTKIPRLCKKVVILLSQMS